MRARSGHGGALIQLGGSVKYRLSCTPVPVHMQTTTAPAKDAYQCVTPHKTGASLAKATYECNSCLLGKQSRVYLTVSSVAA